MDVVIFKRDLPALVELVAGRYDVWSIGSGGMRPITEDWPEPNAEAGQVWLREHAGAPWVVDCLINEDRDGQWVSRREEWSAPLEQVTWVAEDGIRYQNPEVVLHHKALQDQPKDTRRPGHGAPRCWPRTGVAGCATPYAGCTATSTRGCRPMTP